MSNYYSPTGEPMGPDEWACAFSATGRHVGKTEMRLNGRSVSVSTVWLGLDHSFGSGPPLIYETMVFIEGADEQMDRYTTYEQARTAHEYIVGRLQGQGADVITNTRDLIL